MEQNKNSSEPANNNNTVEMRTKNSNLYKLARRLLSQEKLDEVNRTITGIISTDQPEYVSDMLINETIKLYLKSDKCAASSRPSTVNSDKHSQGKTHHTGHANNNIRDASQQSHSMHANIDTHHGILTNNRKSAQYNVSLKNDNDMFRNRQFTDIIDVESLTSNKGFAEKTTYCRPVLNVYNQEFIQKTMERNVRLQSVLKKLVATRQRERQQETWKNCINILKNKHLPNYTTQKPINSADIDHEPPKIIKNYNNPKLNRREPSFYPNNNVPMRKVLTVGDNYSKYLHECYKHESESEDIHDEYFAVSSKECFVSKKKLTHGNPYRKYRINSNMPACTQYSNSDVITTTYKRISHFKLNMGIQNDLGNELARDRAIQTFNPNTAKIQSEKDSAQAEKECAQAEKEISLKEKYQLVSANVERLKNKIQQSTSTTQPSSSLSRIENKLDNLIVSINDFMSEVRLKRVIKSEVFSSCNPSVTKLKCNLENQQSLVTVKKISAEPNDTNLCEKFSDHFENIFAQEIDKSKKIKHDIEEILYRRTNRPCVIDISFDVPTKDGATEETQTSLKAKSAKDSKEKIDTCTNKCDQDECRPNTSAAIAVNTDPLGLLALLRVSSESVKQILSYMPHLNYGLFFTKQIDQLPALTARPRRYVCKICGASFSSPDFLAHHIGNHELKKSMDCCVCQHVLNLEQHQGRIFSCPYCGQQFTRAYCCEIHQQNCAKRKGLPHDVPSDRVFLK